MYIFALLFFVCLVHAQATGRFRGNVNSHVMCMGRTPKILATCIWVSKLEFFLQ